MTDFDSSRFIADRYHAEMFEQGLRFLPKAVATFYITQRKLVAAPVIGHSRLSQMLIGSQIDVPRAKFLAEDSVGLGPVADVLSREGGFPGEISLVPEGTIMFAGVPIGFIGGPFSNIQFCEVPFQHAFDFPMTVAARMMDMRRAAGDDSLISVFSLRRDGSTERSMAVSAAAYVGGADSTSDLEAGFMLGIPVVGTMAHFWVQAYAWKQINQEIDPATEKPKHFEQVAFERWLDGNPNGTVLLIDTIDWKMGIVHAIAAALSLPARRQAFRGIRIDSGDLIEAAKYCHALLEANGFKVCGAKQRDGVGIILTGDLDAKAIARIKDALGFPIQGFGIGTKLAAEVDRIAGIIFKLSVIDGLPVMKLSGTPGKETLPGRLQVWRCVDAAGNYVGDIIALDEEPKPTGEDFVDAIPLIGKFDYAPYRGPTLDQLKHSVSEQLGRFKMPLDQYPVKRSPRLTELIQQTIRMIKKDDNDYPLDGL